VRPYGISRDSPWTHISWSQTLDLTFPLLSDWNGDAVRGFGVAQEYRGLREVAMRSAFLVDQTGSVRGAWQYANNQVPDFEELLGAAIGLTTR
jgi:peroxiredoxin